MFWPDNAVWSWVLGRVLGEAMYGGAEAHEVLTAAARIACGDAEAWHREFRNLAGGAAAAGFRARTAGRLASARSHLLRATGYYRWCEFFLDHNDPRRLTAFQAAMQAFRATAPLLPWPAEAVQVPYDGRLLPGYFFSARPGGGAGPAILYVAGVDVYKEELYFLGVVPALERGISVLVIDGPGQGETLRLAGVPTRPDWEHVISAAVDYLVDRPDVDASRVGLLGRSFGAYYAGRGLAHDQRLRAGVLFGAFYDAMSVYEVYPPLREMLKFIMGAADLAETRRRAAEFTLAGRLSRVQTPVLVVHGADDFLVPADHAQRAYAELGGPKELYIYPAGTPGAHHCQHEAFPDVMPRIFDWLAERLSTVANPLD